MVAGVIYEYLFSHWNTTEFRFLDFGTAMDFITKAIIKPACQITVILIDNQPRKQVPHKLKNGQTVMVPMFQSQENIIGKISIEPRKKVEHNGIKVELLGQIEMLSDRSKDYEFISHVRDLDVHGELHESRSYPFEFLAVEMPHDTYNGVKVNLRYILKVTISKRNGGTIGDDREIVVRNCCPAPSINNPIQKEHKVENLFQAEVHFDRSKYHLEDMIIGEITFHFVRAHKVENMHIELRRKELLASSGPTWFQKLLKRMFGNIEEEPNKDEVVKTKLAKFDFMNKEIVIGKPIPITLFLSRYELTPTYENIHNRFSVIYYIKLDLVEEDMSLSAKEEITLYRLEEDDDVSICIDS